MRFFPHAVKQPLLGTESKRERKEKEKDRMFKQSSNKQEACSHWSQIFFIVCQRKVSTGRQLQSNRTGILVLINVYFLLAQKKSETKRAILKYRNNASESKGKKS